MGKSIVLTEGNIRRQLIWLALPLICGNILQQMYNTVDAFIIGRFLGNYAFGAVGVAGTVMNLFIFILSGCCTGIAVIFAQLYGAGDLKGFRREGFVALVFGLLLTVCLAGLSLTAMDPVLRLIQTPAELHPLVAEYLRIIFIGLPATFLYNLGSAALRAAGNTRVALAALLAAIVLNIALALLFVGRLGLGIGGSALATIVSQGVAAVLVISYLRFRMPLLIFRREDMRMDWFLLKQTAAFGSVSALQQSAVYLGKLLVQGSVNALGPDSIAAYTATTRLEGFANSFGDSGAEAVSIFVAQNTGARRMDRVKQGFHSGMLLLIALGLFMSALMFVTAWPAVAFMLGADGMASLGEGVSYMRWISVFYVLCFIGSAFVGFYRGSGRVSVPVIGSTLQITIRVILCYLLTASLGLKAVAIATGVGWLSIVFYQITLYRVRPYVHKVSVKMSENT